MAMNQNPHLTPSQQNPNYPQNPPYPYPSMAGQVAMGQPIQGLPSAKPGGKDASVYACFLCDLNAFVLVVAVLIIGMGLSNLIQLYDLPDSEAEYIRCKNGLDVYQALDQNPSSAKKNRALNIFSRGRGSRESDPSDLGGSYANKDVCEYVSYGAKICILAYACTATFGGVLLLVSAITKKRKIGYATVVFLVLSIIIFYIQTYGLYNIAGGRENRIFTDFDKWEELQAEREKDKLVDYVKSIRMRSRVKEILSAIVVTLVFIYFSFIAIMAVREDKNNMRNYQFNQNPAIANPYYNQMQPPSMRPSSSQQPPNPNPQDPPPQ